MRDLKLWLAASVLACSNCALAVPSQSKVPISGRGVHERVLRAELSNGLRVIVIRNPLAPVVTTELNYLVGSKEAMADFPGTAHALEHMMFRGSPGLSKDQLAEIAARMGGDFDADTTQSVTQFYFTVPAADLNVALHIEATRMRGLDVSTTGWRRERGAIEQEVSRDMSDPQYVFYKELLAVMFKGTPYAHDALGTRYSFNRTTAARLKSFYGRWYAPNNAILIVVGDVHPNSILAQIRKLFSGIPAKNLPPRPKITLQPVTAYTMHLKTDQPYGLTVIAYRMPGYRSRDYAAAVILADTLNSRRGRLNALVPEGKALYAGFDLDAMQDVGLGYATGVFPRGGRALTLLNDMKRRLAEVVKTGIPPTLVAAAKRQELAQIEREGNSIPGLADAWSTALAFQNLNSPQAMKTAFAAVTVADVDRLAHQILGPEHSISAILTPESSGKPVSGTGFGGRESFSIPPSKPVTLPVWAKRALARLVIPEPTLRPIVTTLPNGLHLIIQPESVSSTIAIYGDIRNQPALEEPEGQEGVSDVLNALFSYGGGGLGRAAFQKALDGIAAQENAGTIFSIVAPATHFVRATELLADNELDPQLPESAFKIVRQQVAGAVAGRLESPDYLFGRVLDRALLPKDDPGLRRPTPRSVDSLTLRNVQTYFRRTFRPDLTTMVVIGNVDPSHARRIVARYFGKWKSQGPKPNLELPALAGNKSSQEVVPDKSSVQDTVVLAQNIGINLRNPVHYALNLGNEVLGKGFYASRLYRDLRARTGLVYSVDSNFIFGRTRSRYSITYGCDPRNVSKARAIILRDLRQMQADPVGSYALQRAKAMLLRQIPLQGDSVGGIAENWLFYSQHDLPLDQGTIAARRYAVLTPAQIQNAFRKWIDPNNLVEVVKGPAPH